MMAYIEGNALPRDGSADIKRLAILAFSFILLIVLIFYYSDSRRVNITTIGFAITTCLLFAIVYFKINPLSWTRLFRKRDYDRILKHDEMIMDTLMELDDSNFILRNITVELFYIEYLVVTPRGIFVISRTGGMDDIRYENGVLYAGPHSMERITSGLWRICHFLNIVIKKSYEIDVMPQPVVVLTEAGPIPSRNFDGIIVCTLRDVKKIIQTPLSTPLPGGVAENFAYLLKTRYVRNITF